jgi:hypothetical protein
MAIDMAPRAKAGNLHFHPPAAFPHYFPEPQKGPHAWGLRMNSPDLTLKAPPPPPPDEALIQRVKDSCPVVPSTWIGDVAWLPTPIGEGERPYFPPGPSLGGPGNGTYYPHRDRRAGDRIRGQPL